MANRILGMGDVATLAEQAKKALDGDSAQKLEEKFISGEKFTFDDFLEQLQAMKKWVRCLKFWECCQVLKARK